MRPHALHPGAIQGKEGIRFCHLATLLTLKSEDGDGSFLDEPQEPPSQSLSDAEAFTAYLAQIQAEARQKLKAAKYEAVKVAAESDRESSALSRGAIQLKKILLEILG